MNDVEYLKSQRMTETERLAFRAKYDLDNLIHDDYITAADWYESHGHHVEYAPASH